MKTLIWAMTYRPLPKYLTIQPSKIDGLGLFTLKDIPMGECLGITHVEDYITKKLHRTPLGGFINYIFTRDHIAAGTELTLRYEWYEPKEEEE
jgi:hypothetical protein